MHFKYAVKPSGEQFYLKQTLLSLCNAFQLNGMRFGTLQCVLMQLDTMRLIAMHVSCIEMRLTSKQGIRTKCLAPPKNV